MTSITSLTAVPPTSHLKPATADRAGGNVSSQAAGGTGIAAESKPTEAGGNAASAASLSTQGAADSQLKSGAKPPPTREWLLNRFKLEGDWLNNLDKKTKLPARDEMLHDAAIKELRGKLEYEKAWFMKQGTNPSPDTRRQYAEILNTLAAERAQLTAAPYGAARNQAVDAVVMSVFMQHTNYPPRITLDEVKSQFKATYGQQPWFDVKPYIDPDLLSFVDRPSMRV